jgi:uncharacterized protein (TIGR02145 family)
MLKIKTALIFISIFTFGKLFAQNAGGGVTDVEGNLYKTVILGGQEWMTDNLKVTKYRNGQPIPHIQDSTVWNSWNNGAYVYYKHDTKHGVLYNWMVVSDARGVCPTGWHVPSNADWDTLVSFLGGEELAGGKMKSKLHWELPNTGGTNSSNFHALPKGYYGINGSFNSIGKNAYWWTSDANGDISAWGRAIGYNESGIYSGYGDKHDGLSIRCVKD